MDGQGDGMYVAGGRDSVPPERPPKASLLMAFYTVRRESRFSRAVGYNLLFRFDNSTFYENRARLFQHDVNQAFLRLGGRRRSKPV